MPCVKLESPLKPYLHRTRVMRAVQATRATKFFIISALDTSVNISNVATVDLAEPGCLSRSLTLLLIGGDIFFACVA